MSPFSLSTNFFCLVHTYILYYHLAFLIYPELGHRYIFPSDFSIQSFIGLGYLHYFPGAKVFTVNNGIVRKYNHPGYPCMMPSIRFGTGYETKQNSNLIYTVNKSIWDEYHSNLDLYKIILPVLICWGEFDAKVSIELGYDLYENLGTEHKKMIIFHNSGHSPHFEEPEIFYENVKNFIYSIEQH